jgi:ASC-1-like (ASCH) protein
MPFFNRILTGEKTIESRWLASRRTPWNKTKEGDTLYFKQSGQPITAKTTITKIQEFEDLTPLRVWEVLLKYHKHIGLREEEVEDFYAKIKFKKYCVLIHLGAIEMIRPFDINKKGFGNQAAWINIEDIETIKY